MKRRVKAPIIPIIDAKTITEFVKAVNCDFGLHIPERWPEGSGMAQIYALKVKVTENGQRYTATAKNLFPALGRSSTGLAGRTQAVVTRNVDSSRRAAIGGEHMNHEAPNKPRKKK